MKRPKSMFEVFGGLDPSIKVNRFNVKKTKRKYLEKILKKNQKLKDTPITKQLERFLKVKIK